MSEHEPHDRDLDDEAWLLARERGHPGHPGPAGPAISEATAARYARLQELIAELPVTPSGVTPGADWRQRVLAAIDADDADDADDASADEPALVATPRASDRDIPRLALGATPRASDRDIPRPARRRSRRWSTLAAVFAVAAVVAIAIPVFRGGRAGPTITVENEPANRTLGAQAPSVHDTLIVKAELDGDGELRVYDDDGVEQARCTVAAPRCTVDRAGTHTRLRLAMPLHLIATLHVVLFYPPLLGPSHGRGSDVEAASHAGIAVKDYDPVHVR